MQNAAPVSRAIIIPKWTLNVGELRAAGATVRGSCDRCSYDIEVDLAALEAKRGEMLSLWNRRPPCPIRKASGHRCEGRLRFSAQLAAGTWPWKMWLDEGASDPQADAAHAAWAADQEARRTRDRVWRFLRKRQLHRRRIRAEAARILLLPRDARREAADRLLNAPSHERSFWAEVRLEVLHRLDRAREVDLQDEVDVEPRPGSISIVGDGESKRA